MPQGEGLKNNEVAVNSEFSLLFDHCAKSVRGSVALHSDLSPNVSHPPADCDKRLKQEVEISTDYRPRPPMVFDGSDVAI